MNVVRPVGERALLVEIDGHDAVHRLAALARAAFGEFAEEVIPGHRTVLVVGRERAPDAGLVSRLAAQAVADTARCAEGTTGAVGTPGELGAERRTGAPQGCEPVEISVRYDGADLADVAALAGVSAEEVVRRHSVPDYLVAFVGFAPGFAYLVGGDPLLELPRLLEPRTRIPAGSVAIAGPYSAVYPAATPGGWLLIGTTDRVLFDPDSGDPALLTSGRRVRFRELR